MYFVHKKLKPNTQLWHYKDDPFAPSIGIVREVLTHNGCTGALVEVLPKGGMEPYYSFYIQDGERVKQVDDYVHFDYDKYDADMYIRHLIEVMQADDRDLANEMRREMAMEQGMLHGCDAYNEAMGWEVSYE